MKKPKVPRKVSPKPRLAERAPAPPNVVVAPPPESRPESEPEVQTSRMTSYERTASIVAVLSLLALAAYTWFSMQQWLETRRSNDMTLESLQLTRSVTESSQRARLSLISFGKYPLAPEQSLELSVKIGNSSAMPAQVYYSLFGFRFMAADVPFTDIQAVLNKPARPATVVITNLQPGFLGIPGPPLHDYEVSAIREKRSAFYFVGTMRYDDGFQKVRTLKFCAIHNGSDGWDFCPEGNVAE